MIATAITTAHTMEEERPMIYFGFSTTPAFFLCLSTGTAVVLCTTAPSSKIGWPSSLRVSGSRLGTRIFQRTYGLYLLIISNKCPLSKKKVWSVSSAGQQQR
jgi:hypothetical protein